MAWQLVMAGNKLYGMGTDGSRTEITLPTGITLDITRKMRVAVLNRTAVIAHAATTNLCVDADGTARALVPRAPVFPPVLAAGAGTGLNGAYGVRYSYGVKDRFGRILAESPLSPVATITLANTGLAVSRIQPSLEASVNCRFVYRTTTGGDVDFRWVDLDDNEITSYDNNLGDAGLSLLPTLNSSLGIPPGSSGGVRLKLIAQWKNRLWACSTAPDDVSNLRYCEQDQPWAWPTINLVPIPVVGEDQTGITAIMPRRDDMAVFKAGSAHKMTGDSGETFQRITITKGAGLVAPDSVQVIRDTGYGLGADGVYQYDDDGFRNISQAEVDEWFNSDSYFNRAMFPYAEGRWNPFLNTYELHLAAAGSTALDRWVSYDLNKKHWLGPHETDAFTPTCAAVVLNSAGSYVPLIGGDDGFVYTMNNAARRDGASSAIDFDVRTVHTCNTPDIEKMFLQLDLLSKIEAAGTLNITPTVGGLDAAAQAALAYDLTLGREKGAFIGTGRILQLRWRHDAIDKDVTIYGAELPYFEIGRK